MGKGHRRIARAFRGTWAVALVWVAGCTSERPLSAASEDSTGVDAVADDVAGGQSGGQTSAMGDAPVPCACLNETTAAVRARVTRNAGGCVELEVIEPIGSNSGLAAGAVFGGVAQPLCWNDPPLASATIVLAVFSAGQRSGAECPEYRGCSLERCGNVEDAYESSVDPDCEARRNAGEPVDCQMTESVDEEALLAWDACDGQCAVETRDACALHADEDQLGGTVRMAPLADDEVSFYWAGELQSESVAELSAADCQSRHGELFQSYFMRRMREREANGTSDTSTPTAPPPDEAPPSCPLE